MQRHTSNRTLYMVISTIPCSQSALDADILDTATEYQVQGQGLLLKSADVDKVVTEEQSHRSPVGASLHQVE